MERKYLEYFEGAFDSTVADKIKPENKPYVAYSKTDGTVYSIITPQDIPNNWVLALPKLRITDTQKSEVCLGGPIEVPNTTDGNNHLLYADLEGLEGYSAINSKGDTIALYDPVKTRGEVLNEDPYTIYKHLHLFKVVQADTWYPFTAPFDIYKVASLETKEEADIAAEKSKSTATKMQAEANLNMLYELLELIKQNQNPQTSNLTLDDLLASIGTANITLKHYNGKDQDDDNYGATVFNSNYYLYEIDPREFMLDDNGNTNYSWVPVSREAGKPLMYAGQTYALQFTWCPMCNDLATRDYYDYWSNKIIYFYGKGAQDICGTNQHEAILETAPSIENLLFTGNYTLKDYTLPSGYIQDLDPTSDNFNDFVLSENQIIKPTEGYMAHNPNRENLPDTFTRQ